MELRDEGREIEGREFAEKQFEERLRRAMQRMEAPAGFAETVLQRARVEDAPRRGSLLLMPVRTRAWLSGALAAGMLGGAFWAGAVHVRRERERAEMAQRKFEDGIRITDRALDHARQQLRRSGVFGD